MPRESNPTRRRVLASTAFLALSGCIGSGSREGSDRTPTDTAPEPTEQPTPIAEVGEFVNTDNWTANDGRVDVSEMDPSVGSRSIRLSCGTSHNRAMASYRPSRPIDLSESYPSLAFRYGKAYSGGQFRVWIKAPDTENRIVYERSAAPGNGWIETPLLTPDEVVGEPDLSNVQELTFFEYTGGGQSLTIWLDAMTLHERPETSAVVFTFDDGHSSVAETARPILEEFGYAGSVAAIPGRERRDSHLSLNELAALRDEGWDVMSHPQRSQPLPAYDAAKQEALIKESKVWLESQGFPQGARFFVYPYSSWDRTTLNHVSEYHDAAFAGHGVTTWNPPTPALTSRIKGDDPAVVESYLERLSRYGGVMPLMYHGVESDSKWISPKGFRNVVSSVSESNVDVLTVGEWYDSGRRM